jgi:hypothetical protein
MALQYSVTDRTNKATQLATDIGTSAVIKIFTGSPPTNCGTADTGTLLVTFAGNASGFGTASSGVLTVSAIANATASASGTAGYFRVYPSSATTTNAVIQGLCGTSGSDMNLTTTTIASGQTCAVTSWTITEFGV